MRTTSTPDRPRSAGDPAFRLDVASAAFSFAPLVALSSILPYIAVKRFAATMAWVGIMNAGIYLGLLGNAVLSLWTARLDMKRSLMALLAGGAALMVLAAFQRSALPYCVFTLGILCAYGLLSAQYDTFLVRLYPPAERPRRLSFRWMAVSLGATGMAPLFGRLGQGPAAHRPVLLCGAGMLAVAAVLFSRIPAGGRAAVQPVSLRRMIRVLSGDRRFVLLVVLMILFGWMGAGIGAIDVALYRRHGLGEFGAGLLSAANTAGMIVSALAITPFLRFRGGIGNFRLCFSSAASAAFLFLLAGIMPPGPGGAWIVGAGNFIYGITATGFTIASQTALANMAGEGDVILYVNGFKFVQGFRGIAFPILVAWTLQAAPIGIALALALVTAAACAVVSWIPAADRS